MPAPVGEDGFSCIGILGLGLIGGSIAAGIKSSLPDCRVIAWDASKESLESGLSLGVIDAAASELDDLYAAEIIVLAIPVQAMAEAVSRLDFGRTIVTDVGSVKGQVIEAVTNATGDMPAGFVPGHPIAGSERHGVTAANPALFKKHQVILTPLEVTDPVAIRKVTRLWESLGAQVVTMSPEHHDSVLAQTSHLPHLLAFGLVETLAQGDDSLEVFEYAAGGFRDFSRIAASDPVMWRDIFLSNPGPVLEVLDRFSESLAEMRQMIESGDGESLKMSFSRAKEARDHFAKILEQRQSS